MDQNNLTHANLDVSLQLEGQAVALSNIDQSGFWLPFDKQLWDRLCGQNVIKGEVRFSDGSSHALNLAWQLQDDPHSSKQASVQLAPVTSIDNDKLNSILGVLRKESHIAICSKENVEYQYRDGHPDKASDNNSDGPEVMREKKISDAAKVAPSPFDAVQLTYTSFPECHLDAIDTTTQAFGRSFDQPFMITGMTGGRGRAKEINYRLAQAAQEFGVAMGVGSQRMILEDPSLIDIFDVKKMFPRTFLIGNIGISQLMPPHKVNPAQKRSHVVDTLRKLQEMIQADAMAIHVNVMQEAMQWEGQRDFRGYLETLALAASIEEFPILVKEVGFGFSLGDLKKLAEIGVKHVDIGGSGGTSWTYIEGRRHPDPVMQTLGEELRNWGNTTPAVLQSISDAGRSQGAGRGSFAEKFDTIVATGGIRTGTHVAKSIGLGANICGIGLPFFRAALHSSKAVHDEMQRFAKGLQLTMLGCGVSNLKLLKNRVVYK